MPYRELTYPTLGKGNFIFKSAFGGDVLVLRMGIYHTLLETYQFLLQPGLDSVVELFFQASMEDASFTRKYSPQK